jgi:hypothetical protein
MMNMTRTLLVAGSVVLALGLSACGGDSPTTPPTPTPTPIPLTAPEGVSVTTEGRTATFVWNAVAGVTRYRVLRDGAQVVETPSTIYKDQELAYDTRYCYTVQAMDGARVGPESAQACARTRPDYSGSWAGTTSQGLGVTFTVENDFITTLTVRLKAQGSTDLGPCSAERDLSVADLGVSGRGFSHSGVEGTYTWEIAGTFESASTASGTANLQEVVGFCQADSGDVTWTATRP